MSSMGMTVVFLSILLFCALAFIVYIWNERDEYASANDDLNVDVINLKEKITMLEDSELKMMKRIKELESEALIRFTDRNVSVEEIGLGQNKLYH